jgi:hypothetical protein
MKRQPKKTKAPESQIQVWTYEHAIRTLPYLTSIVGSLREHRLQALTLDRQAKQLANRPGRPDRNALLAYQEAVQEAQAASERFEDALADLLVLDIFCTDPLRGEAIIPFVHDNQLAWFLFDLFDPNPLSYWRYHTDPLETRRPIAEALEKPSQLV